MIILRELDRDFPLFSTDADGTNFPCLPLRYGRVIETFTDSLGCEHPYFPNYYGPKFVAENMAKNLADECELRYETIGANRLFREGKQFIAIGGYDHMGEWHMALDYSTSEDRADVKVWMRATE